MIVLLFLLVLGLANTQNIDSNSAIGVYQNFTVSWVITNRNSVVFNIISKQPGFFALMYSQSMINVDIEIFSLTLQLLSSLMEQA